MSEQEKWDVQQRPTGSVYYYIIGVDPGVETGFAVYCISNMKLLKVCSMSQLEAFDEVMLWKERGKIRVIVEDARLISGIAVRKVGAGSVRRSCQLWQDFLLKNGLDFSLERPKRHLTKLDADAFKRYTGWSESSNSHGRDAGMICYRRVR